MRKELYMDALKRIVALDPTLNIGQPPDPLFFIRQAQLIAKEALNESR